MKVHEDFPDITSPKTMLPPLKYIANKAEIKKLEDAPNLKQALDMFWLETTGSHDRARKAIQHYYNRVQNANFYFTSYYEGWKTDRGMIYIVYGPPTSMLKDADTEIWNYGEAGNMNSIKFTFRRVGSVYADNDFRLERSALYKSSWLDAINILR